MIILINPIIKIKIGLLKTFKIGDYFIPIDIFLLEKEFSKIKKNEIFLWFCQKDITNKYFFNKIKKKILILPGFILQPIQLFFLKFRYTHKFIFYKVMEDKKKKFKIIHNNYEDKEDLLIASKSQIEFSEEEKKEGYEFLKKNRIFEEDKIVSFSSRTKLFRDENYTSLRNGAIKAQMYGIDFLIKNGFKAIRIGRESDVKIDSKPGIFDYTSLNLKNDLLEFFIVSRSKFMICTDSGINAFPIIMRIPRLIINFVHFKNIHMNDNKLTPIILPKKMIFKRSGELLSYREIFKKKFLDLNIEEEISKEFKLLENSKEEILDSVKEIYNLVEKNNFDLEKEKKKQSTFWNMVKESYGFRPKNVVISPSFFEKNPNLFL